MKIKIAIISRYKADKYFVALVEGFFASSCLTGFDRFEYLGWLVAVVTAVVAADHSGRLLPPFYGTSSNTCKSPTFRKASSLPYMADTCLAARPRDS